MKLSLLIPCYNEEEGIPNLSQKITPVLQDLASKWEIELVFVDDGSKDQTYSLLQRYFAEKPNTKIIHHETNKNLGAALRTGFAHATGDVIVTIDSDCSYDPREIIPMLDLLDDHTDIVTASPYHPLGKVENVPKYRLFLSKSISFLYRLLTRSKIHTFTALVRAQKRKVVDSVAFSSPNFLATAEMLINALDKGYVVKEYPTTLRVREFGVSKMRLLKVMGSHAKYIFSLLPRAVARPFRSAKK